MAREAASASAGLDGLIPGGLNVACIVAEHEQGAAHLAELVRSGGGDRHREIASGKAKHAFGQRIEPRYDVAMHEQPDDQTRDDKG